MGPAPSCDVLFHMWAILGYAINHIHVLYIGNYIYTLCNRRWCYNFFIKWIFGRIYIYFRASCWPNCIATYILNTIKGHLMIKLLQTFAGRVYILPPEIKVYRPCGGPFYFIGACNTWHPPLKPTRKKIRPLHICVLSPAHCWTR